ncbi:hypothetical protein SARC_06715 [Sphaeroforma arctica JP610]|uniref:Uncharacterized protein n=1 Tax=Sphaeroforma arctica JP610 TaxID=667725 RepID=A0A0L0FVR1_9EUKA|nr:hypothetical protein SARC_06715 [Sphaeroforma arctica JP610]KNC80927.1 hypothetical protein SARC_06715 [Sphaeroforma arctica JP610]|eukprot:XP_014154829.1 hypothetical protein SARC_06715 [Sphaeroforma arctica JP610]
MTSKDGLGEKTGDLDQEDGVTVVDADTDSIASKMNDSVTKTTPIDKQPMSIHDPGFGKTI